MVLILFLSCDPNQVIFDAITIVTVVEEVKGAAASRLELDDKEICDGFTELVDN